MINTNLHICSRCIYDERVDGIEFDDQGVCNYCKQVDSLRDEYGTGDERGEDKFLAIVENIKREGKGKPYDCILGISGGTDSSYMVFLAKKYGLRPLAVHYDNTWNSAIATQNIRKVLEATEVDLFTHVVDNKEADDIFRSFFFAGVAEIEGSTDLAIAEVMYRAAWKFNIKYILDGHSFTTEGITPVGRNYFDGKYIQEIHKSYGTVSMKTYPLMTFARFIWWTVFARIRRVYPFWYLEYSKERAREYLQSSCDWSYYGGHHLENRMTSFLHSVYAPRKFGMDFRNNTLSALARNNQMSREEAWERYNSEPFVEPELEQYFQKRLGLSEAEYQRIMTTPPKFWYQFPSYKERFEKLRPLFYVLSKSNLVPKSFYLKYCFPAREVEIKR